MGSPNMKLKLLVDKKTQTVLFAEATKEFVDFLFHIFSLPLGTLIQFIGSENMVGSLGELKESLEEFNQAYLQSGVNYKDKIFNQKTLFKKGMIFLSNDILMEGKPNTPKKLYRCSYNPHAGFNLDHLGACGFAHVSEHPYSLCPKCRRLMNVPVTLVSTSLLIKKESKRGYVKDMVTYMVMDNLVVKPMSTISSITLINSFGLKDLSQLEEETIHIGKDEVLELLKASLITDEVLTHVYQEGWETLAKKKKKRRK